MIIMDLIMIKDFLYRKNSEDGLELSKLTKDASNSDIDWSQSIAELGNYRKYGLSDDEIAFIESKVKEMG